MSGPDHAASNTSHRIRKALALYLFATSVAAVMSVPGIISLMIRAYSLDFPSAQGPHVPAFTQFILPLLANALPICAAVLVATMLLAVVAWRRAQTWDVRLFWLGVLASFNFFHAFFALGNALMGFFLLPALANAT